MGDPILGLSFGTPQVDEPGKRLGIGRSERAEIDLLAGRGVGQRDLAAGIAGQPERRLRADVAEPSFAREPAGRAPEEMEKPLIWDLSYCIVEEDPASAAAH